MYDEWLCPVLSLHLLPAKFISYCPHLFLEISFPGVPWSPSSSVTLRCPLQCLSSLLNLCPNWSSCTIC